MVRDDVPAPRGIALKNYEFPETAVGFRLTYSCHMRKTKAMKHARVMRATRCKKCQGMLRSETAIDLHSGVAILQYVCFNCGRRWHQDEEPRPLTAA